MAVRLRSTEGSEIGSITLILNGGTTALSFDVTAGPRIGTFAGAPADNYGG
jgi:hypothetical protein